MFEHNRLIVHLVFRSIEQRDIAFLELLFAKCDEIFGLGVGRSSSVYFCVNLGKFSGLWPNHSLSSVEGAMDFAQKAMSAFAFAMPLGQSLSIKILKPSVASSGS